MGRWVFKLLLAFSAVAVVTYVYVTDFVVL